MSDDKQNLGSSLEQKTGSSLWGGRFQEKTDAFVQRFTASESFDRRFYAQDIRGSIAHATMLNQQGVLSNEDFNAIEKGLNDIQSDRCTGRCSYEHRSGANCKDWNSR